MFKIRIGSLLLRHALFVLTALVSSPMPATCQETAPLRDPETTLLLESGLGTDPARLLKYLDKLMVNEQDLLRADALVKQLGSKVFATREEANRKLLALGAAALPALRNALDETDAEAAIRLRKTIRQLEDNYEWAEQRCAVRVLLRGRPSHKVIQTLVRFLPYTPDETAQEDIWFGVYERVQREPLLRANLVEFLNDPFGPRRALAGLVLSRLGDDEERQQARSLLKDPSPLVRLRTAQGLLGVRDHAAVPALLDVLKEPAVELCWSAEELLFWVAGRRDAPETTIGAASRELRDKSHEAWHKWWAERKGTIDWDTIEHDSRRPLLLLVRDRGDKVGRPGPVWYRRVWLCGCDGRLRWQLHGECIRDVRLLPCNRMLVGNVVGALREDLSSEHDYLSVHDLTGKILKRMTKRSGPVVHPLPNGQICFGEIARVNSDGNWIDGSTLRMKGHDIKYVEELLWGRLYFGREGSVGRQLRTGNLMRGCFWQEEKINNVTGEMKYTLVSFPSTAEIGPDGGVLWEAPSEGIASVRILDELIRLGLDRSTFPNR